MAAPQSSEVRRIEIAVRPEHRDPRGESVAETVRRFLGLDVGSVRTRDVYKLAAALEPEEAERFLVELVDPVLQHGALDRVDDGPFDFAIEVAFKPGVTDPVGKSARIAVEDTLQRRLADSAAVYTSTLYLLTGVERGDAQRIAFELLANPVIQTASIQSFDEWRASEPDRAIPRVTAHAEPTAVEVELSGSDADLERISRERLLALTLPEMRAVRDHFRRAGDDSARRALGLGQSPTDVELECIAQTWSEHCKHKIFNATITLHEPGRDPERIESLFKTFIRGTTDSVARSRGDDGFLVSVFHDNAGVVAFDSSFHLVYKVETHNSPSALDPYGGAITGIVGVNRDPFGTGLGADLLSNVWGYCFASPDYTGALPKGLLHPRRIRDGVHRGVIDGGNQSGIPYGRGWELFDARFLGKPLVFCGTVGRLPVTIAGRPGHEKGARPGDKIVMVGGRIGADGIHGATFSSAALDESAPIQAVQIGDPITQKRMFDFLTEARERGLYTAITDNGAGGLSSSVGEMATGAGGARLDLSLAPLKYPGLAPWEILLSEAQERMTLAVSPDRVDELLALSRRREVESTVLGEFSDTGHLIVDYGERCVARLSLEFLHDGAPDLDLVARWTEPSFSEPDDVPPEDLGAALVELAGRLNVASNEAKARHYDHEVKGLTVVKPFVGVRRDVPAEATVFLAQHGSRRGYVLSEGVNPFLSDLDCYWMAQSVVDLAIRRQLCAGAGLDRIALLDNFCWPDPVESEHNPGGSQKLAQLVRACRGLYEAAVAYGAPLISGKDSMKNDSTMGGVRISVPPTLLVSALGQIDDVNHALTLGFERPGDVIYLLGTTRDETGGSEWFRLRGERARRHAELGQPAPFVGSKLPKLDLDATRPLYAALSAAIGRRLVRSASAPALGGLALALARSALAGELGAELDLDRALDLAALPADVALFSESNGRFVITAAESDAAGLERALAGHACVRLGTVTAEPRLSLRHGGRSVVHVELDALRAAFTPAQARPS